MWKSDPHRAQNISLDSIRSRPLSALDALHLCLLAVVAVFYVFTIKRTPWWPHPLYIYPGLLVFVLVMARLRASSMSLRHKRLALFLYPIVFLLTIFETLFMIVPYFSPLRPDAFLAGLDRTLLGVDPTVWMEGHASPPLTDLLYFCYVVYLPMPLIPFGWMFAQQMFHEVEESTFTFFTACYASYILYFFFPAVGPRDFLKHDGPLRGIVVSDPIRRLIDLLELNRFDAFPSLHAAILLTTMLVVWRYHKKMFAWFLPVAAGITVSLIYCRYHYFVDVLAGFVIGGMNFLLSRKLFARICARCVPHFGVHS
jgi:membrane-associated phospholipid phosphatase